jgi:hypothetical protein
VNAEMAWFLYALAGWETVGAFLAISAIGKPRKPTTPAQAAVIVAISAGWIVLLVLAAGRLM